MSASRALAVEYDRSVLREQTQSEGELDVLRSVHELELLVNPLLVVSTVFGLIERRAPISGAE
jgi:hypothetical protein